MTDQRTTEGVMGGVEVLDIGVYWADGFVNDPSLTFLLDRALVHKVYDKRPCDREQISGEQAMVVGSTMRQREPGWHIYHSDDDGFAWFFTWGGKPDDGFGGWRRTVRLTDGTDEEIVGGWHVSARVAEDAGFAPCVDAAYRLDYLTIRGKQCLSGGTSCFVEQSRLRRELERLLPDVEVIESHYRGLTVKWRGQPSKAKFMETERVRRDTIRDELKAKYRDDSWHGGDWYRKATDAERASLACLPYSALGPVATVGA